MSKSFFITLMQLVLPVGASENTLPSRAAKRLGIPLEDILSWRTVRRSLDARKRRGKAVKVYHLRLELPNRWYRPLRKMRHSDIHFETNENHLALDLRDPSPPLGRTRPLVVGAGPAGLFAALRLARAGWKPIVIERGDNVETRRRLVADFWRSGRLVPESNVLYGLGGAGLFSDGKLNTRHKDREGMRTVLSQLVAAGAPESILIDAQPHVGTDLLTEVVTRVGRHIEECGGEIHFGTRLDLLETERGILRGVTVVHAGKRKTIETDACVLATGHSARDTYEMLAEISTTLEAKPFAIGLRVEMPQEDIDASQGGNTFRPVGGEAAAFRLSRAPTGEAASCYTFCMCPGGQVIPCASEPGRLAVNGMSLHARAGDWGNAAFLTPVTPAECLAVLPEGAPSALAGIHYQRIWEEKAYALGRPGGEYCIPASRLEDFVASQLGTIPEKRGVSRAYAANLWEGLPEKVAMTLADAIPAMVMKLRRVNPEEVMLYAIETRTSSPVRVVREVNGESVCLSGLFPAGEGSGYAGGIMTSALDGWKAAGAVMTARPTRA